MLSSTSLIIAVCVAGVFSAPHQICSPNQWQGVFLGKIAQFTNGKPEVLESRAMSFNDHTKNMESFVQNVTVGSTTMMIRTVSDFTKMKTYDIRPKEMKCTVTDMPAGSKMPKYCEDELKRVKSFTLGGKMADTYEVTFHNSTMDITLMRENMIPVSSLLEQHYMGIPQMIVFVIGNVSAEISDSSVFDIPSYCMAPIEPKKRVCEPDQYETTGFGKVAQVAGGSPMVIDLEVKMFRDHKIMMESSYSESTYMGEDYLDQNIIDFNKKVMYSIDLKKKTCRSLPAISQNMVKCSDSDMLEHLTSLSIDGKMADMYAVRGLTNTSVIATIFRDNLETISTVTEQNYMNIPQMIALQFGNTTMGIKDPDVFKVPSYCNKEDSVVG